MSMSTNEVVQRTEGTVAIDIIDASQRQLVWEGAASGRVTDQVRQNRAEAINVAVRDILAQFP
jgi:outer membrane receptor protein involved in Fe transport